jgi:hypothetical protein
VKSRDAIRLTRRDKLAMRIGVLWLPMLWGVAVRLLAPPLVVTVIGGFVVGFLIAGSFVASLASGGYRIPRSQQ